VCFDIQYPVRTRFFFLILFFLKSYFFAALSLGVLIWRGILNFVYLYIATVPARIFFVTLQCYLLGVLVWCVVVYFIVCNWMWLYVIVCDCISLYVIVDNISIQLYTLYIHTFDSIFKCTHYISIHVIDTIYSYIVDTLDT